MRRQISGSQVFQWPAFPEQQFSSCTMCNPFQSRRVRCTGSKNSQERSLSSIIYKSLTISVKIISYSQYKKGVYDRNVLYDSLYKLCLTLSLFIYLKKITSTCFVLYVLPKNSLVGYFKWLNYFTSLFTFLFWWIHAVFVCLCSGC